MKSNKIKDGTFKYIPFYLDVETAAKLKALKDKYGIPYNELFIKLIGKKKIS
jgi:hypothetical protein